MCVEKKHELVLENVLAVLYTLGGVFRQIT